MPKNLCIALGQINVTVGDFEGNYKKIEKAVKLAQNKLNADLIVFPEMVITGYPTEDLLHRDYFFEQVNKTLKKIQSLSENIDILLGYPQKNNQTIFNAAIWFHHGKQVAHITKNSNFLIMVCLMNPVILLQLTNLVFMKLKILNVLS